MAHEPQGEGEMELNVGDTITLHRKLWNGYSEGHNHRTGINGNFPEYKTQEKPAFVDFN